MKYIFLSISYLSLILLKIIINEITSKRPKTIAKERMYLILLSNIAKLPCGPITDVNPTPELVIQAQTALRAVLKSIPHKHNTSVNKTIANIKPKTKTNTEETMLSLMILSPAFITTI